MKSSKAQKNCYLKGDVAERGSAFLAELKLNVQLVVLVRDGNLVVKMVAVVPKLLVDRVVSHVLRRRISCTEQKPY